jgi:Zn-dependent protease
MKFLQVLGTALSLCNVSLGRWFGIPVTLHWSWVIIFVLIVFTNPSFAIGYIGLFAIVLLHELGHCFAGKYYNMYIKDIVLYPFGGAASMSLPAEPMKETVVALSGPFVNLLLIFPLFLLQSYHSVLWQLHIANIVLLVFNLLPAFPMDGGRVMRAILCHAMGDRLKATRIAYIVAKCFCVLFLLVGVIFVHPTLVLIAGMIYLAGKYELDLLERQDKSFPSENNTTIARRVHKYTEDMNRFRDRRQE